LIETIEFEDGALNLSHWKSIGIPEYMEKWFDGYRRLYIPEYFENRLKAPFEKVVSYYDQPSMRKAWDLLWYSENIDLEWTRGELLDQLLTMMGDLFDASPRPIQMLSHSKQLVFAKRAQNAVNEILEIAKTLDLEPGASVWLSMLLNKKYGGEKYKPDLFQKEDGNLIPIITTEVVSEWFEFNFRRYIEPDAPRGRPKAHDFSRRHFCTFLAKNIRLWTGEPHLSSVATLADAHFGDVSVEYVRWAAENQGLRS
jgi:hypothetical protein